MLVLFGDIPWQPHGTRWGRGFPAAGPLRAHQVLLCPPHQDPPDITTPPSRWLPPLVVTD